MNTNKKRFTILLILILLQNIMITITLPSSPPKDNHYGITYYVDSSNTNGPWDGTQQHPFQTIQDAYIISSNGDNIFIFEGIYHETLLIEKNIYIKGSDQKQTIIKSKEPQYIFSITKNNVRIENLTLCNTGGEKDDTAIKISANDIIINNCIFHHAKKAIHVQNAEFCSINNCIFYQNGDGIALTKTKNISIQQCTFIHNSIGIHEETTKKTTIKDCYCTINGIGIYQNNTQQNTISTSALFNNNDNQGGIFLDSCRQLTIYNSIINHNGFGLKLLSCHNIMVFHSRFQYNTHTGFYIGGQSQDIIARRCEFSKNLRFSIYGDTSEFKITGCNFDSTIYALYTENCNIIATQNWWDSTLGPSKYELPRRQRISPENGYIPFIPWSFSKYRDAGANWDINQKRIELDINYTVNQTIIFHEPDDDNDGVPNWWEEKYNYDPTIKQHHNKLDPDNDGLTNIQECYADPWNADPYKKDIFLEFDWIETKTPGETNKPSDDYINQLIETFEEKDITLHIDTGNLGGGENIPYDTEFTFADLQDLYWDYFLHNDMNNPRKGIFHYALICDYGPAPGFAFIGWDHLDSFCISAEWLSDNQNLFDRPRLIIGGSIHELGHTLGLTVDDHGGNDNTIATMILNKQWIKYLPYKSCMNYWYTYKILTFSDGTRGNGDFNDWEHMDFSFFKSTHYNLPEQYR